MKCSIENCKNQALLMGYGKWLCAECFMEIKKDLDLDMNNKIEQSMKYINNRKGEN